MRFGSILILVLALAGRSGSAQTRNDLPGSLESVLDKEYPGWSFPSSDPHFVDRLKGTGMFPNLVFGDYNQDGQRDYAVRIEYRQQPSRTGAIIAFVSEGADFVPHIIRSYVVTGPRDLSYSAYLQAQAKGSRDYDYESEREFVFGNDAFMEVFDGKGAVSYIFEDGKFRNVITGD